MRKPVFAICKQQRHRSASVAEQAGLSFTRSQTPKTGFLVTRLTWSLTVVVMQVQTTDGPHVRKPSSACSYSGTDKEGI